MNDEPRQLSVAYVDDNGVIVQELHGRYTIEVDSLAHHQLLVQAATRRKLGLPVLIRVDIDDLASSTWEGRQAAFVGVDKVDADRMVFSGGKNSLSVGLIKMTVKLKNPHKFRYFSSATAATKWLLNDTIGNK